MPISEWWQRLETSVAVVPAWLWLGTGIIAVAVLAFAAWWWVPKWQMKFITASDPKARADIEDNFRKTIGQALGGIAVLFGAMAAYLQFTQQQNAAHDLLISNQIAKGFEQLGSPELAVRLGGIYSLEGVMNGSPQYHQPVLEALCAFVRAGTIGMIVDKEPTTDIQAALTVIGWRADGPGQVNLTKANISGTHLSRANLAGANVTYADLSGAILFNANLSGADLSTAKNLTQTQLDLACGDADTKLPVGLTLKPCSPSGIAVPVPSDC